jgi:hypothetical protein
MRPIVSCVNSIPEIFLKWVDHWLKKVVLQHVPTYIKDSEELISTLRTTFPNGIPKGAKLFFADAVSMYSNINTDHGIKCIVEFLDLYKVLLPEKFPKENGPCSIARNHEE